MNSLPEIASPNREKLRPKRMWEESETNNTRSNQLNMDTILEETDIKESSIHDLQSSIT